MKVSCPTNGTVMVLKARAENGSSSPALRTADAPPRARDLQKPSPRFCYGFLHVAGNGLVPVSGPENVFIPYDGVHPHQVDDPPGPLLLPEPKLDRDGGGRATFPQHAAACF